MESPFYKEINALSQFTDGSHNGRLGFNNRGACDPSHLKSLLTHRQWEFGKVFFSILAIHTMKTSCRRKYAEALSAAALTSRYCDFCLSTVDCQCFCPSQPSGTCQHGFVYLFQGGWHRWETLNQSILLNENMMKSFKLNGILTLLWYSFFLLKTSVGFYIFYFLIY